ncbi:hypothetical protein PTW37_10200 [Arthrobacter agilis]|uniref:hypothetical protein n=1 Tax=Arthrobacter agilis TaxID=37921 RepID=UPI0023663A4E|nr:hypothetical protein [Arthrobacter agilis]WDF32245.1 hypothetical protein PTW37_10200 [Arthrobacter agilis]
MANATQPKAEKSTTLDSDTTKPSVTAPGDGPADTTDPDERAQSAPVNPGPDALAAGTVNAVKSVPKPKAATRSAAKERVEKYKATKPNGDVVTVTRNIDTGVSKVEADS